MENLYVGEFAGRVSGAMCCALRVASYVVRGACRVMRGASQCIVQRAIAAVKS